MKDVLSVVCILFGLFVGLPIIGFVLTGSVSGSILGFFIGLLVLQYLTRNSKYTNEDV